jgi:hypothetical protein
MPTRHREPWAEWDRRVPARRQTVAVVMENLPRLRFGARC